MDSRSFSLRSLIAVWPSVLPVLSAGCYSFVPARPGEVAPAASVRAYLSEPARQRLWAVVPPDRRFLDGKLNREDGDTLLIEVSIRGAYDATTFVQRIPITRDEIVALQVRRLDRLRTSLAGGLFVAVAASLVVGIFTGPAGGGAYPPVDDGQTESVVPGFVLQR